MNPFSYYRTLTHKESFPNHAPKRWQSDSVFRDLFPGTAERPFPTRPERPHSNHGASERPSDPPDFAEFRLAYHPRTASPPSTIHTQSRRRQRCQRDDQTVAAAIVPAPCKRGSLDSWILSPASAALPAPGQNPPAAHWHCASP